MGRVFLTICFLAALANVPSTLACECVWETVMETYHMSAAVFTGVVEEIDDDPDLPFKFCIPQRRFVFRVGQVYKGEAAEKIAVFTSAGDENCGAEYSLGSHYIVYALQAPYCDTMLRVTKCSRPQIAGEALVDLVLLPDARIVDDTLATPKPTRAQLVVLSSGDNERIANAASEAMAAMDAAAGGD